MEPIWNEWDCGRRSEMREPADGGSNSDGRLPGAEPEWIIRVIARVLVLLFPCRRCPSESSNHAHSLTSPFLLPLLPTLLVVAKDTACCESAPNVPTLAGHNFLTLPPKISRPFADSSTSAIPPPKQASDSRTLEFLLATGPIPPPL